MSAPRRASQAEQARIDAICKKAIKCWDDGWNRVDEDHPGQLRRACCDPAFIEVEIEVWFFIRGAYFGIGDFTSRQSPQVA